MCKSHNRLDRPTIASAGSSTVAGVDPVDALRRIAFLLERAREQTYRVQAYRAAADALAALPRPSSRPASRRAR